jgi:glycosyltransferase involved in cell wall biosynthesis
MHIIINTRFPYLKKKSEKEIFLLRLFIAMAKSNPEHQFSFIAPAFQTIQYEVLENVKWIKPPFSEKNILAKLVWKSILLPKFLKKINADCLIGADGMLHPKIKIPQLIFSGTSHQPVKTSFGKKEFSYAGLQKRKSSVTLIAPSYTHQQDIISKHLAPEKNTAVLYPVASGSFLPVNEEQKNVVKAQISRDCEYFTCIAANHSREHIIKLLKAFSIFKKRLKSNMKLIVCGNIANNRKKLLEELDSYRFKEDVIMMDPSQTDKAIITGNAYASIVFLNSENDPLPLIESLCCHIPILYAEDPLHKEVAGEAGLAFQSDDFNDLAVQMMQIYKDESLHKKLTEACEKRKTQFSIEEAVRVLSALLKASTANE